MNKRFPLLDQPMQFATVSQFIGSIGKQKSAYCGGSNL